MISCNPCTLMLNIETDLIPVPPWSSIYSALLPCLTCGGEWVKPTGLSSLCLAPVRRPWLVYAADQAWVGLGQSGKPAWLVSVSPKYSLFTPDVLSRNRVSEAISTLTCQFLTLASNSCFLSQPVILTDRWSGGTWKISHYCCQCWSFRKKERLHLTDVTISPCFGTTGVQGALTDWPLSHSASGHQAVLTRRSVEALCKACWDTW